ncbi:rRNA adenine N-6-methyltransferase family protein [Peribacillus sp. ACCC06369]|uniref:class I SAM-dependent methyltransferase n=1 Tax=Peribacillus sp. ACCC06369 TaxID=3055860 RepID=UPI0025A15705|nr:rRNA adenine N-6-methyltransferase family protein [Peribacillus sp. ACCC06369]MDM5356441.1 rRNA adenine N-6-methyltransferase family protein [Peribacillus sp. ACCC06369]
MKKFDFSFIYQYIVNPKTVGAILPSSRYLSNKMIKEINFKDAKYIVEYGPGTGVFTEKILALRNQSTIVVLIENNREFYYLLKKKFWNEKNFIVIHGSAEHVQHYLNEYKIPYADYIISGLPFASLPQNVSNKILSSTLNVLKTGGEFVTFQYTKVKIPLLKKYFSKITLKREYRNIPPAYILRCEPREKNKETLDAI